MLQQLAEPLPWHRARARSAIQPLAPDPTHLVPILCEAVPVAGHAIVVVMAHQLSGQLPMLFTNRLVAVPSAPLRDGP